MYKKKPLKYFALITLNIYFLDGIEYFRTGRGNKGLRIDNCMYKRHYETANSVYWICTLSNKLKCKQRVIAEKDNPFKIRFKGPGHNHSLLDYQSLVASQKATIMHIKSEEIIDSDPE